MSRRSTQTTRQNAGSCSNRQMLKAYGHKTLYKVNFAKNCELFEVLLRQYQDKMDFGNYSGYEWLLCEAIRRCGLGVYGIWTRVAGVDQEGEEKLLVLHRTVTGASANAVK